jgi:hypothetical protein
MDEFLMASPLFVEMTGEPFCVAPRYFYHKLPEFASFTGSAVSQAGKSA